MRIPVPPVALSIAPELIKSAADAIALIAVAALIGITAIVVDALGRITIAVSITIMIIGIPPLALSIAQELIIPAADIIARMIVAALTGITAIAVDAFAGIAFTVKVAVVPVSQACVRVKRRKIEERQQQERKRIKRRLQIRKTTKCL